MTLHTRTILTDHLIRHRENLLRPITPRAVYESPPLPIADAQNTIVSHRSPLILFAIDNEAILGFVILNEVKNLPQVARRFFTSFRMTNIVS